MEKMRQGFITNSKMKNLNTGLSSQQILSSTAEYFLVIQFFLY